MSRTANYAPTSDEIELGLVKNPELCGYCGEPYYIDVLEVWGHEWQLDTCCEGSYWEAVEDLQPEAEVEGFEDWFADRTGMGLRSGYTACGSHKLDFGLRCVEITRKDAKAFIAQHHRHNPKAAGDRARFGVYNGGTLVAVAMAGRPSATRMAQRGYCPRHRDLVVQLPKLEDVEAGRAVWPTCQASVDNRPGHERCCGRPLINETAEVTRLCVSPTLDGQLVKDACSMLYSACAKAMKALEYDRVVTYIREDENGASVEAAGWLAGGETRADKRGWANRPGRQSGSTCKKTRWELGLNKRSKKDVRRRAEALAAKRARRAARLAAAN